MDVRRRPILTDKHPSHTFAAPGSYSVRLVVTDQEGQKGETTQNVVVAR